MDQHYDLVALGGGAGGLVASLTAAGLGARVALVEQASQPGGDCLFTGCVPSKSLIASAKLVHQLRTANRLGLDPGEPSFDFARVMERVESVIEQAGRRDRPDALRARGVEVVRARGRFVEPGVIEAGERRLRYRSAVIATGSRPLLPAIPGIEAAMPLTSDDVFELRRLPRRVTILGGGAVGVELGQALARLGSTVSIVEGQDRLVPSEDAEAARLVAGTLQAEGIELQLNARAVGIEPEADGAGVVTVVSASGARIALDHDRLLVAVGRRPVTEGLGLEEAGVELDPGGAIRVDAALRTTAKRVFAAGDVTGAPKFTHVAGYHGAVAAGNALFRTRRKVDHSQIPHVVFTDPELASVGMTEAEAARELGRPPVVFRHDYRDSDRALTAAEAHGMAKLIVDRRGRLLGATIFAPAAGESIAEVARLVRDGEKVGGLSRAVHAYPTFTEGPARAATEWWSHRYLGARGRRLLRLLMRALGTVGRVDPRDRLRAQQDDSEPLPVVPGSNRADEVGESDPRV
jgi:pyruvate/2-oxoglutarate dehydrogenase complex dihydrolipoamide dehydrogenase (E3) component